MLLRKQQRSPKLQGFRRKSPQANLLREDPLTKTEVIGLASVYYLPYQDKPVLIWGSKRQKNPREPTARSFAFVPWSHATLRVTWNHYPRKHIWMQQVKVTPGEWLYSHFNAVILKSLIHYISTEKSFTSGTRHTHLLPRHLDKEQHWHKRPLLQARGALEAFLEKGALFAL